MLISFSVILQLPWLEFQNSDSFLANLRNVVDKCVTNISNIDNAKTVAK